MSGAGIVLQQHRRLAVVADQDVEPSVVVVVADGQTARGILLLKHRAGLVADMRELRAIVPEEEQRLLVADLA